MCDRAHGVYTCIGPISYKGHAAVQTTLHPETRCMVYQCGVFCRHCPVYIAAPAKRAIIERVAESLEA